MSASEPMTDPTLPGEAQRANDDVEQFSLFGAAGVAPMEPTPSEVALSAADLDAQAQALWDADRRAVRPAWSQLGDTTKSVWRDYVLQGKRPEDLAQPPWDEMPQDRPRGG